MSLENRSRVHLPHQRSHGSRPLHTATSRRSRPAHQPTNGQAGKLLGIVTASYSRLEMNFDTNRTRLAYRLACAAIEGGIVPIGRNPL